MWRAGPPRGCDAALRPRGRAAGGPRKAQVAHKARTCGRRPRVSTRVHADAREGATWREGVGIWRAHGLVAMRGAFQSVGSSSNGRRPW